MWLVNSKLQSMRRDEFFEGKMMDTPKHAFI